MSEAAPAVALPDTQLVAERYQLTELLGRGGMACVHRAKDLVSGREVALKQLFVDRGAEARAAITALFEREFHVLAQLRHPHVIAVYDYGLLADDRPYYTMELLDGGDLRDRAPLPWRELSRLMFDVCSSLALLHSRRLLHRDITPRNIRCTHDGGAKLIDFGAMAPMTAGGADVLGTPAFVAPETVHRSALDARTDLFSVGATMYHALTGRAPYPAITLSDAVAAWTRKVAPPSRWTPNIPAAMDDLVLALINPEPALRPQSAFEVMQRLAAIGGLRASESEAVSRAYLATPLLVGRDGALEQFRERLLGARLSRGGALRVEGHAGVGRSRLLDAFALEAKTLGFTVLRATAAGAREPFAVARDLTQHLLEVLPDAEARSMPAELLVACDADGGDTQQPTARRELRNFSDVALDADGLRQCICRSWFGVSRNRPLLIAVDDVHRIDAQSAAVLAALLDHSRRAGVFVALTIDSGEPSTDASSALSRRCELLAIDPLTLEDARRLLESLFGAVPHLDMLTQELHAVTLGNPRQCMDVAQYLVDRGVVRYVGGTWVVPARLSAEDLPRSGAAAMRARIDLLSPNARFLGETQALAFHEDSSDRDYRARLPKATAAEVERALAELVSVGALTGDGSSYRLSNRLWRAALLDAIEPSRLPLLQRALATAYGAGARIPFIYHAFEARLDEEGLEALSQLNAALAVKIDHEKLLEQNVAKMMACYPRALESAERLGKSPRFLNDLRRWHLAGMTTLEDVAYPHSARLWFAQLEHDSGLDLYCSDPDPADPMRLMRALEGARQRYLATPEAERVYTVEEAIRLLAEYVVFGIVIGGRCHDTALLRSLPPLLEPFAIFSPLLDAIWNNAIATYGSQAGQFELARERWLAVLSKLESVSGDELSYGQELANAISFAIGLTEAHLGLASATTWADRLDQDPYQRVAALQLRRIMRLEHGDSKGAERFRRQAEVLALQSRGPQMFKALLAVELNACAMAADLTGVQDALERMRPLAARYPGWVPNLLYGEACFHLVRGDHEAAMLKCEECIALTDFDAQGHSKNGIMWLGAQAARAEALLAMGDAEAARTSVVRAIETIQSRRGGTGCVELTHVLALAEAKLGVQGAVERLEASIAQQLRLGVTGVRLGVAYETRAQIAIWHNDAAAFQRYAELTAREYRYGAQSGLGTRYDRLINDAGRHGLSTQTAQLADASGDGLTTAGDEMTKVVSQTMSRTQHSHERANAALQLLCAAHNAEFGHLYVAMPGGLLLSASQQGPEHSPAAPPTEEVELFLRRTQEYAAAMEDMATDELSNATPVDATVEAGGVRYQLLLLSCTIDGKSTVAAVAAVAENEAPVDALRREQLRSALATHLLQARDTSVGESSTG